MQNCSVSICLSLLCYCTYRKYCSRHRTTAHCLNMSWGCLQELDVESGSRRTWDLSSNEVSVGRMTQTKADDKLTIKWPKAYISGHHFSIKRSKEGEMCELFDHSSNGTFKNGELIGKGKSSELRNGDIIQLRFKQVDKIILTFIIFSVDNSDSVNDKSSNKRKRVKTEEEADDKASHRRDADNLSFIRISALEQDNKQQEARIEAYITKLETSARENSNLLRELKAAKDDAQEKGSQLEELKQQCLVQEAHTATIEARVHKLEENLQAQKANTEKLRCQLAISEEKSAQTNELLLKVETLSDELKHRKSQNDSRSTICDELSLSLDNEKKLKEAVELQLDDCKDALAHSRTEALHLKHLNDVLKEEQSHTNSKLRESQAKIELLEAMARQVKIEEESNVAVFKRQFAAISASFDQLQAEVTSFGNSFPPQPTRATIESCFLAMEQLQDSAAIEKVEGQQQQQDGGDQDAPSCTQVHTPDRMKKTVSGDSTIAFSKSSAENLECTEMISTEMPKAGLTANSEYRQCSMYDTISMTEEGVDMEKIEEGSFYHKTQTYIHIDAQNCDQLVFQQYMFAVNFVLFRRFDAAQCYAAPQRKSCNDVK